MEQLAIDYVSMTGEEEAVLEVLKKHRGKGNAISVPELTKRANYNIANTNNAFMSETRIRQIVRHLTVRHGKLIGSATKNPPGYFIPTNAKEVEMVCKSLRHRALSILYRECRIRGIGFPELLGQLALEIGNSPPSPEGLRKG